MDLMKQILIMKKVYAYSEIHTISCKHIYYLSMLEPGLQVLTDCWYSLLTRAVIEKSFSVSYTLEKSIISYGEKNGRWFSGVPMKC